MSSIEAGPLLTAVAGLVVGIVGSAFGLVKWMVPRIDAGYKSAIKIQEKQQETMAVHLERLATTTAQIVYAQADVAKILERLSQQSADHYHLTDVHRAQVDIALGLQPGGLASGEGPSARARSPAP